MRGFEKKNEKMIPKEVGGGGILTLVHMVSWFNKD